MVEFHPFSLKTHFSENNEIMLIFINSTKNKKEHTFSPQAENVAYAQGFLGLLGVQIAKILRSWRNIIFS